MVYYVSLFYCFIFIYCFVFSWKNVGYIMGLIFINLVYCARLFLIVDKSVLIAMYFCFPRNAHLTHDGLCFFNEGIRIKHLGPEKATGPVLLFCHQAQ